MPYWDQEEIGRFNRRIITQNIDRDPVGRQLTPQARGKAIDFALSIWKGDMGNGEASQIGIRHATADVIKPK